MDNFDTEKFIQEIESHPLIWDSTLEESSNKELKKQSWDDIVDTFGGKCLSVSDRRDVELTLQKKWKCIRNCFTRELRRQERLMAGVDPGPRKSEYTYFRHLQFLRKVVSPLRESEISDYMYFEPPEVNMIKQESSDTVVEDDDPLRLNYAQKRPKYDTGEDEDKMFLLSMLSTLKNIPIKKKLSIKIKLLKVLDEATKELDE